MKRKRITSMGENSSTVRYECRGSCAGSHKPYANEKNWINHFDIYLNQRETVDKTADYFQSAYADVKRRAKRERTQSAKVPYFQAF